MDRSLATLIRSLQTSPTHEDAFRLLPSATSILSCLSNPLNVKLLSSQILERNVLYPRPIRLANVRQIFSTFYTATLRFREAKQAQAQAGGEERQQPYSALSETEWITAVVQGASDSSPRWRHSIMIGALLLALTNPGVDPPPSSLRQKLEHALVKASNLALTEPDGPDSLLAVVFVLNHTFQLLADPHKSHLDYDLLLPALVDSAFFSPEGLEQGYSLSSVDQDVRQAGQKFTWSDKSRSFEKVKEIKSRPLVASLGPLSSLLAYAIDHVHNQALIIRAVDRVADFTKTVATVWRQSKLSEVDRSEEAEFLDSEMLTTTLPTLLDLLRDMMFAIIITLRSVFGRLLVDPYLAADRTAPTLAIRSLHILRSLFFVSHRFGQHSSSQYEFVYFTAIDVLNQYPPVAENFLASIRPATVGQIPAHPLDRLLDLYLLNTAEHFTLSISAAANDLSLHVARPYIQSQGDRRLGELYEAAHSLTLSVFAAPQNSDLVPNHISSYLEILIASFPATLDARQFRLAIKSIIRLASPPSSVSHSMPFLQEVTLDLLVQQFMSASEAILPPDPLAPQPPGGNNSARRAKPFVMDDQTRFLYLILKQLDLKIVNWQQVADDLGIKNGHAARMRWSRFRGHVEGAHAANNKKKDERKGNNGMNTKNAAATKRIGVEPGLEEESEAKRVKTEQGWASSVPGGYGQPPLPAPYYHPVDPSYGMMAAHAPPFGTVPLPQFGLQPHASFQPQALSQSVGPALLPPGAFNADNMISAGVPPLVKPEPGSPPASHPAANARDVPSSNDEPATVMFKVEQGQEPLEQACSSSTVDKEPLERKQTSKSEAASPLPGADASVRPSVDGDGPNCTTANDGRPIKSEQEPLDDASAAAPALVSEVSKEDFTKAVDADADADADASNHAPVIDPQKAASPSQEEPSSPEIPLATIKAQAQALREQAAASMDRAPSTQVQSVSSTQVQSVSSTQVQSVSSDTDARVGSDELPGREMQAPLKLQQSTPVANAPGHQSPPSTYADSLPSPMKAFSPKATAYQIWPMSYKDSNGDGVGDIPGVTSTLPYLKDLGIDFIWLSPMYDSPQKDFGYDIANYEAVYPPFGTLKDMDDLIAETHRLGLKIILDLVINHTSDQHAWFKESASSRTNDKADWYIWKDPKIDADGNRQPPNNWQSIFRGSAWEYVPARDQYYLHLFAVEQPDLNWENEAVRKAIQKTAIEFWLDRGVDGFRVDTANLYSKDTAYPDAEVSFVGEKYQPAFRHFINGPRMHEWLQEQRAVIEKYGDIFLVGELPHTPADEVLKYVSAKSGEYSCVFDFDVVNLGGQISDGVKKHQSVPHTLADFKEAWRKTQHLTRGTDAWTTVFLENHDQVRSVHRFGSDSAEYRDKSAKMLSILLSSLSGTLFIYQGQEIAMTNFPAPSGKADDWTIDDIKDVDSLNSYHDVAQQHNYEPLWLKKAFKGLQKAARDNSRLPVQWDDSANAGFTTGKPWMRINDDYRSVNVKAQLADPKSPLNFWKKVLKLRKAYADLTIFGDFEIWDKNDPDVFTFTKQSLADRGRKLVVFCSFSNEEEPLYWPQGVKEADAQLLISNVDEPGPHLSPWEGRVYLVQSSG
ncbi:hypothetical protein DV735_g1089, partial [Chaetothyriales sp. CBS 134920]